MPVVTVNNHVEINYLLFQLGVAVSEFDFDVGLMFDFQPKPSLGERKRKLSEH